MSEKRDSDRLNGANGGRIRRVSSRGKKAGLSPGSLVYVGTPKSERTRIYVVAYDAHHFEEAEVQSVEEAFAFRSHASLLWINIDGVQDVDIVKKVGDFFSLHTLALEDILNSEQRPKREEFENFVVVIMKALSLRGSPPQLDSEQVGIFLGKDFVVSFQEKIGDAFEPVRQRLKNATGRLRTHGPDYLMYALMDTLVDNYFLVLEHMGERIEDLEAEIVKQPNPDTLRTLYGLKRSALFLRRAVWPLREVVSSLERAESSFVNKSTLPFLRDVYSHTVEVIDTIETFREMLSGMLDIYLSSVSNRMNVIIKVLTIITTIFMPLTFIAGIYGMNFKYMPELEWPFGYPLALAVMALISVVMLFFFRRRGWI